MHLAIPTQSRSFVGDRSHVAVEGTGVRRPVNADRLANTPLGIHGRVRIGVARSTLRGDEAARQLGMLGEITEAVEQVQWDPFDDPTHGEA